MSLKSLPNSNIVNRRWITFVRCHTIDSSCLLCLIEASIWCNEQTKFIYKFDASDRIRSQHFFKQIHFFVSFDSTITNLSRHGSNKTTCKKIWWSLRQMNNFPGWIKAMIQAISKITNILKTNENLHRKVPNEMSTSKAQTLSI